MFQKINFLLPCCIPWSQEAVSDYYLFDSLPPVLDEAAEATASCYLWEICEWAARTTTTTKQELRKCFLSIFFLHSSHYVYSFFGKF